LRTTPIADFGFPPCHAAFDQGSHLPHLIVAPAAACFLLVQLAASVCMPHVGSAMLRCCACYLVEFFRRLVESACISRLVAYWSWLVCCCAQCRLLVSAASSPFDFRVQCFHVYQHFGDGCDALLASPRRYACCL
jgi:hypothetical protein